MKRLLLLLITGLTPGALLAQAPAENVADVHALTLVTGLLVVIVIVLVLALVWLLVGVAAADRRSKALRMLLMLALPAVGLIDGSAFAQDAAAAPPLPPDPGLLGYEFLLQVTQGLAWLALFLALCVVYVADVYMKRSGGRGFLPILGPFTKAEADAGAPTVSGLWAWFSGQRSTARNFDKPIEGHEYDGIVELDNNAPPLFNYILYGSIIIAASYMIYYHVLDGPLMIEEYNREMYVAAVEKQAYLKGAANAIDESNIEQYKEPAQLAAGAAVFKQNCTPCHGEQGQGAQVGPNLTDTYWLHGGSIREVFTTIKYGVQGKGMIAWQEQLSPGQMAEVASFVLSLQGTNPPNPKAPEGEPSAPGGAVPADSSAAPPDTLQKM